MEWCLLIAGFFLVCVHLFSGNMIRLLFSIGFEEFNIFFFISTSKWNSAVYARRILFIYL